MKLFLRLIKGHWYGGATGRFAVVTGKKQVIDAVTFVRDELIQVRQDSVLGTDEDQCGIVLDGSSPMSCALYFENGTWWIKSTHHVFSPSLNQTVLVNTSPVTQEPLALRNGDEIEFGNTELEIILEP